MALAETFYSALAAGIGSELLLWGFVLLFFMAVFVITRQNLASGALLATVTLDALTKLTSQPILQSLYFVDKFLIFLLVGIAIVVFIRR